ncbi:hypothetical protein ACVU7I_00165 [Patulibacter sp. S7RM1-6]
MNGAEPMRDRQLVHAVAEDLLDVELRQDGIAAAVSIGAAGDELQVDWATVTNPSRSHGAVTLALMARSLVEGDPVDLSGLSYVDGRYAAIAAAALAKLANGGRA